MPEEPHFKFNCAHWVHGKRMLMSNPYLPSWEYIPDGEPRLFGDRVYIYGSHDHPQSEEFCDFKLKAWSASVDDLDHWVCHGVVFSTKAQGGSGEASLPGCDRQLYAPDVVEKDGKYYLYAYIVGYPGTIAVSDRPEGPFEPIGQFDTTAQLEDLKAHPEKYLENPDAIDTYLANGKPEEYGTELEIAIRDLESRIMIDPGVLVDDDGRVYVYCGYLHSYMFEVDPTDMRTVIPGTYQKDFLKKTDPHCFFEACSPRKINGTYYLIYSPRTCGRLAYATSDSPMGPFTYRGYFVDNGVDYPGGNDHGSVCKIKDQWYIFYHRMTNNTIMSRRGTVEPITLNEDGTFSTVLMTSNGFRKALSPYEEVKADLACVLKGGCYIAEKDVFTRPIVNLKDGCVVGFRSFDFGEDYSGADMNLFMELGGSCETGTIHVHLDGEDGPEIGSGKIPPNDQILSIRLDNLTGIHSLFFRFTNDRVSWMKGSFTDRELCRLNRFVVCK